MKLISIVFLLFNLLFLTACNENEDTIDNNKTIQLTDIELGNDDSYSNTTNTIAKSLHLELDINFENKSIYGIARHTLNKHTTDTIVFDVNGLQIQKVTIGNSKNEKNTDYVLGIEDSVHGAPLSVKITKNTRFVNIYYQTTEKSSNLHWITDSSQTTPFSYLYTLPGEKHTRSWIPVQDVSTRKIKFSAKIKLDRPYTPILGAQRFTKQIDSLTYSYSPEDPSMIYDIGLFIGSFKYRKLNSNLGMYSLSNNKEHYEKEFKNFNHLLNNAELFYGKHPWKSFDVCILPNKFPFKSFDYPNLSFIHPVLISKYQFSSPFLQEYILQTWPNPLFSTKCEQNRQLIIGVNKYLLHRITEIQVGKDYAELTTKQYINQQINNINTLNLPVFKLTNTYSKPCDKNLASTYSERIYFQLKGFLFMKSLENQLGKQKLDAFIKNYATTTNQRSIEEFERELKHILIQNEIIRFPINSWLHSSKINKKQFNYFSKRHTYIHTVCKLYLTKKNFFKLRKTRKLLRAFTHNDWITFLSLLPNTIDNMKLVDLDKRFRFSNTPNKPLLQAWIRCGIQHNYNAILPIIEKELNTYGDLESNYTYYQLLLKNKNFQKWTKIQYSKNKNTLPIETRKALKPLF